MNVAGEGIECTQCLLQEEGIDIVWIRMRCRDSRDVDSLTPATKQEGGVCILRNEQQQPAFAPDICIYLLA